MVEHLTIPTLRLNVPERRLAGCRAFSGDWGALAGRLRGETDRRADLVVTSETIYSRESWPRLLGAVDAGLADGGTAYPLTVVIGGSTAGSSFEDSDKARPGGRNEWYFP